jgi:hypothetical protein
MEGYLVHMGICQHKRWRDETKARKSGPGGGEEGPPSGPPHANCNAMQIRRGHQTRHSGRCRSPPTSLALLNSIVFLRPHHAALRSRGGSGGGGSRQGRRRQSRQLAEPHQTGLYFSTRTRASSLGALPTLHTTRVSVSPRESRSLVLVRRWMVHFHGFGPVW